MKIVIFGAIAALLAQASKWRTVGNADSTAGPPPIEVGTFSMTTGRKWEIVNFTGTFSEAPVVVVMPTTDGGDPCTIYIKDVTTTGFKAAPAEPYNKDGAHPAWNPETISYIAAASGTWELGGKKVVAGKKITDAQKYNNAKTSSMSGDGAWDSVTLGDGFSTVPALLTQIQTTNNNADFQPTTYAKPFLTVACQSVSTTGASLALERLEVADHGSVTEKETIGWIAIETGTGAFLAPSGSTVKFSSIYTDRVFQGWGTSKSVSLGLAGGFPTDSPLVIASQNSRHGNNGGWLRLKSRSKTSVSLVVDEDNKVDSERNHVTERAGIFAVSAGFYKPTTTTTTTTTSVTTTTTTATTTTTSTTSATTTTTTTTTGPSSIEVGTFVMTTGKKWESVTFSGSFSEAPVVVVMPTTTGGDPCTIYIKDVTATGFKAAPAEPYDKDGAHAAWNPETISYIAVASGTWELGGKKVVAGKKITDAQKYNNAKTSSMSGDGAWDSVTLGDGFSTVPALLTQIQTTNNNANYQPTTYAKPFLTVACQSVSTTGASLALERLEVADHGSVTEKETIGWIAIETGTGAFLAPSGSTVKISSIYTDRVFQGWGTSKSVSLGLAGGFPTDSPLVIASQNSRHGNNGGWLRLKSRSKTSVSLVVDEDNKVDSERNHVTERAGIFAASAAFHM